IPADPAVLEVRCSPIGHGVLIGDRIAHPACLPAGGRPRGADGPVHLVRAGGRRPVETPALAEVVVAPNSIGSAQLVGHRVAGRPGLPAGGGPLRPDRPVHFVRAGGRRPVAAPALAEVVEAPHPVGSGHLVGHRVAGRPGLPAGGGPLRPDRTVHLVRASGRRPVDGSVLVPVSYTHLTLPTKR